MSSGLQLLAPRLLRLREYEFDPAWRVPLHTHSDEHELLIVTGGQMGLRMPDGRMNEARGSVLIFPQQHAHECWTIGSHPLRMCCIWWEDPATRLSVKISRQDQASFQRIESGIQWLREIFLRRQSGWPSAADGLLQAILHECGVVLHQDCNPQNRIQRAQSWVRERFAEPLTLDAMAEAVQMSRSHFAHEFKRNAGCSPMQYLRKVRIEAASRLLVTSPLPLKTIAMQTGFRDAFELSRVIKRMSGRAPSAIRHAVLAQSPNS